MPNEPLDTGSDSGMPYNGVETAQDHQNSTSREDEIENLKLAIQSLEQAIEGAVIYLKNGMPELALLTLEGTKGFEYLQKHYAA